MPALYLNQLPAGPVSLSELLEPATADNHRWDRQGRLIRLRSTSWFLDRPREVPLRLVRRWQALVDQHGALPIEAYTEMVATLKPPQLATLSAVTEQVGLPHEIGSAGFHHNALQFYTALSPAQHQALWRGGRLPVLQLTPAQRSLFLKALRALTRRRPTDPEQLAAGAVSLRIRPMLRTREVQSERVTFQDQRLTPGAEPPPVPPSDRPDASRRYAVLSVTLLLECGELRGITDLIVPAGR
jgi:hypothetical protein